MAIFDIFSKRQRRNRGELPDIYKYDELSRVLRVQIVHIIQDAFGTDQYNCHCAAKAYAYVNDVLCREYGLFELVKNAKTADVAVLNFFLNELSIERTLDVIELCFIVINIDIPNNLEYLSFTDRKMNSDDAVRELNERFNEHGVGYQFVSNKLIRVDSKFVHAEVVKPTLLILSDENYKGANEEFLCAHEHYRHSRYKECLVDALKSFESTMKSICKIHRWTTQPTDTAKNLINTCFEKGLLPKYLESQMGSLRSLLESGIPTVRNKLGGHGQGPDPVIVPEYYARYALNLTATSILFLAEASAAKK